MARDTPKIRKARNLAEPADATEESLHVSKPSKPMIATKRVEPKSQTGKPIGKNRLPHG